MKGVKVGGIEKRKLRVTKGGKTRFYISVSGGKRSVRVHEESRRRQRGRRENKGIRS
jgi:hypothetical protein